MNKKKLFTIVMLISIMIMPSSSIAIIEGASTSTNKVEETIIATEEKLNISPRYEECACGGRILVKLDTESSWGKGRVAICKDGLAGHIWEKVQTYKEFCNSCGYASFYTETVEELRCSH